MRCFLTLKYYSDYHFFTCIYGIVYCTWQYRLLEFTSLAQIFFVFMAIFSGQMWYRYKHDVLNNNYAL